ncbi:MAG: PEP-CTERM sorting domain-containing protein [Pseudomonadota bacterium]
MKSFKLCLGALAALLSVTAQAAPIVDGLTEVRLDEPVALAVLDAGVTPSATGTGTFDLNSLTFGFPITGGDLSEAVIPGSTIEHDGSGILFTAGNISIEIGNFLINTTDLVISGFVRSINPATGSALDLAGGVPLFDLSTGSNVAGFPFILSLTGTAAGALNATFGTDLFSEGLRIGTAATGPIVADVPAPESLGLLMLGAVALGLQRRRRLS